jgi:hypothetical protein
MFRIYVLDMKSDGLKKRDFNLIKTWRNFLIK